MGLLLHKNKVSGGHTILCEENDTPFPSYMTHVLHMPVKQNILHYKL